MNKEKAKNRTFTTIQTENKSDTIRKRPFTNNDNRQLNFSNLFFFLLYFRSFLALQDGILFQVRAVYTYLPIHEDEISIKPNDIINVTRMVCLISCSFNN